MEDFEEKLSALMSNPQLMQQIMSMAQSLGHPSEQAPEKPEPVPSAAPDINPAMLGQVMKLAGQTSLDRNQTALLRALQPYLTGGRLQKLEKAMRATKIASLASTFISSGELASLFGR